MSHPSPKPGERVGHPRLEEVHFYPLEMDTFLQKLGENGQVVGNEGERKAFPPATEIWIGRDEHGKTFIGWRDTGLASEMQDWVRQYS